MHELSKLTVQRLLGAGWHPNRRQDTTRYERLYKEYGHPYSQTILDFLSEFDGLHIDYPDSPVSSSSVGFKIDPFDKVGKWRLAVLGKPVCLIGVSRFGILVMALDGVVYSFVNNHIILVGKSGYEAINTLCE
jgi:hypothetical protein